MKQPALRWGLAGALLISMTGCLEPAASSDSGSSSGGGYSGGDQANGGMGGSGSGTVSGYGSIIINGIRKFNIDDATLVLDGEPLGFSGDNRLPIGVSVEYLLGDDVDENLSSGTALEVRATHQVIGPVTSGASLLNSILNLWSLEVMGQNVEFDPTNTTIVDEHGSILSLDTLTLSQGDVVKVSGLRDGEGSLHATRLVVLQAGAPSDIDGSYEWQLVGRTTDLSATADVFHINDQAISLANGAPVLCPDGIAESQKVRVVASEDDAQYFTRPGYLLQTAAYVECLPDGLSILQEVSDVPDNLPVTFSGIVGGMTPGEVVIDGQRVLISDDTSILQLAVDGTLTLVDSVLRGELFDGDLTDDITGEHIDVDGHLGEDGAIDAKHIIILSPLAELVDEIACSPLLNWLPGCSEPLVYTESPLNEDLLAASGGEYPEPSISVLGLQPQKLGVDLGEVSPTKEFSRHVFAAIESSTSGTEPEQSADSGMLVASLQ